MGNPSVTLTSKASPPDVAATLPFNSAVVTVGTGLTRAKVTRSIQKKDDLMQYKTISTPVLSAHSFDSYSTHQLPWNTTSCPLGGTPGTIIIPSLGNATFVYGTGWLSNPSTFQASVDAPEKFTLSLNSSLPHNSVGHLFFNDLLLPQFNTLGFSRMLTIDTYDGEGHISLDYIEIVDVTGGSPFTTQPHTTLIVVIFLSVIVIVLVFLYLVISSWVKGRSAVPPPAVISVSNAHPTDLKAIVDLIENTDWAAEDRGAEGRTSAPEEA
jgi:hypothetical protein